ncbi:MAG TPA: M56 family metallopeptidase [Candidatus Angelobacter sp.]|nr:M56 family metallopeptidase [Candidatus Angelobacter sp.]
MLLHRIAIAVVQALLDSIGQGALILVLAWLALTLLQRKSSALRHVVAMVFLIAFPLSAAATFWHVVLSPIDSLSVARMPLKASFQPPLWLGWIWGIGVAVRLLQFLRGWRHLRRLEALPFTDLPEKWRLCFQQMQARLGISRSISVRILPNLLPCSARLMKPIIWLPATMLSQLPSEQIEAIFAHELAHIHRLDWLWNAVQCAIETVMFYHPAVWWVSGRIRQERENACDDLAVSVCGDAIVVAEALGALEWMRRPHPMLALSLQGGSLMKRISRLIEPGKPRFLWNVPVGILAMLGIGVIACNLLAVSHGNATGPAWWQKFGGYTKVRTADGSGIYERWSDSSGAQHQRLLVNGSSVPMDESRLASFAKQPPSPPNPPLESPAPLHLVAFAPAQPPDPSEVLSRETVLLQSMQSTNGASRTMGDAVRDLVENDSRLSAAIGVPVRVNQMVGPSRVTETSADLTVSVSGPLGERTVKVLGSSDAGRWNLRLQ